MKINRHSIFLKLNLLFTIAIVAITIVFFVFFIITKQRELGLTISDSRQVMRILKTAKRSNEQQISSELSLEGYTLIKDKKTILKQAKPIKIPKRFPSTLKRRLQNKKLQILKHNRNTYFYINLPRHQILVQNRSYTNKTIWVLVAYLAIISILLFLYIALKNSLKPIKKLEHEIKKFSNGDLNIDTKSDKLDEIAQVGNQFYEAVQKINKLQNTKTLFMRNMMHELKTPITKGKLSLSLMQNCNQSIMLDKIFKKLESLVNEMAEIEQITAGDIAVQKSNHNLIDIIENAKDLLYLKNHQISHNITDQKIFCDFKLFSIVTKNLIENGIKYSTDHKIRINVTKNAIEFINHSTPLKYEFNLYLEPFYKGELKKLNQGGFGLGLYIVDQIVKLHGFSLEYKYKPKSLLKIIINKKA